MSGRYAGYLICTDLDGTLMNGEGKVSHENAEAIRLFQQQGGKFTVSTGRARDHLENFREDFIPNAPVITFNGAYLYDAQNERELYRSEMDCPVEQMLEILKDEFDKLEQVSFFSYWEDPEIPDEEFRLKKMPIYYVTGAVFQKYVSKILSKRWLKMVFVYREEADAVAARDKWQASALNENFIFGRSWKTGLEMLNRCASKGETVCRLKAMMPEIQKTVCVGDYENDLTMIQLADIGYAVANAVDEVKQVADRITVSHNESAIAKIIAELPELNETK